MLPALLLLAAQADAHADSLSWRCVTRLEIDGHPVSMWRDYAEGESEGTYVLQTLDTEVFPYTTYWQIHSSEKGPAADAPPTHLRPRTEASIIADGPEYVHIDYRWHTEAVGPIWAHYWGDGEYAGAEMLFSSWQVRKMREKDGKIGGLSGGLSRGPVMKALAGKRDWTVAAVDATGKRLFSTTFRPPMLSRSLDAYRRARTEMDAAEREFRIDHKTRDHGTASCADNVDLGEL